jgi:NOL1/NOP2/sun family putative RNA methylase
MKLPEEFLKKMKDLLGEAEYEEFYRSYSEPRHYGLRVNTLKASVEEFVRVSPFDLESVPWTRDGFYYREGASPGRHPYYYAGLYYIQEPSAMLPGEVLDARPGERILDLCAAPGGKTVQIAAGMRGQGLLVANDISSDRVKALVKNIELCGVRNAMVTNETPERLAGKFTGFFDKILVDAPCSGEGMFRKDEEAARSWEKFKCEKCSCMQWEILQSVDRMLKPGGSIVYSTCTFSPEEDERMLARFMEQHKGYELVEIPHRGGVEPGRPDWADGNPEFAKTARLWPHKLKGEGHFVARLRKNPDYGATYTQEVPTQVRQSKAADGRNTKNGIKDVKDIEKAAVDAFHAFRQEHLKLEMDGFYEVKGSNLYWLPEKMPDVSGLKIAKFGWYLGEVQGERFTPSHSMVIALKKENLSQVLDLKADSRELSSYLKGETVMLEGFKGLTAVCVDGYLLGWAKGTGDMMKNLYPKGWRKMA